MIRDGRGTSADPRSAERMREELERPAPGLARLLVAIRARLEAPREEAVVEAQVYGVLELNATRVERAREFGDGVHPHPLVAIPPESEDGSGHAVDLVEWSRRGLLA